MDKLFSTDRYYSLYDLTLDKFIDCLIKTTDEESLNKYNQKITSFIIDNGGQLEDVCGVQGWLDKLASDSRIYGLERKAIDVRLDTHNVFYNKINSLSESNYLHEDIKKDEEISEMVFLRNCLTFYCNCFIPKAKSVTKKTSPSNEVNHLGNLAGLLVAGMIMGVVRSVFTVDKIDDRYTFIGLSIGYGLTTLLICVVFGLLISFIQYLVKKRPFSTIVYKTIWIVFATFSFLSLLKSF